MSLWLAVCNYRNYPHHNRCKPRFPFENVLIYSKGFPPTHDTKAGTTALRMVFAIKWTTWLKINYLSAIYDIIKQHLCIRACGLQFDQWVYTFGPSNNNNKLSTDDFTGNAFGSMCLMCKLLYRVLPLTTQLDCPLGTSQLFGATRRASLANWLTTQRSAKNE